MGKTYVDAITAARLLWSAAHTIARRCLSAALPRHGAASIPMEGQGLGIGWHEGREEEDDEVTTEAGSTSGSDLEWRGRMQPVPVKLEPARRQADTFRPLHWEDALRLLQAGVVDQRPSRIVDEDCDREQVFLERPILKRRKGDDKWLTSGGRKGALECWDASGTVGVLKRYGRVVRKGLSGLKFAQYTLQTRETKGDTEADHQTKAVWVIQPLDNAANVGASAGGSAAGAPFAPTVFSVPKSAGPYQAAVDVHASQKFIAFKSSTVGEEGMELGAVVRGDRGKGGVKLQSSQGDFAEWYKRAAGEAPMEEGDVVGFRRGRITRKTGGCGMLGIVSRKAVVEGSAPPEPVRHLYDTVAHCGVVPVKLSLRGKIGDLKCECPAPRAGQLLTPSGRNDGTAALVQAAEGVSRVGILLDDSAPPELAAPEVGAGYQLVTVLVVAPPDTTHGAALRTSQIRNVAMKLVWLMATLAVAVVLVKHIVVVTRKYTRHPPFALSIARA